MNHPKNYNNKNSDHARGRRSPMGQRLGNNTEGQSVYRDLCLPSSTGGYPARIYPHTEEVDGSSRKIASSPAFQKVRNLTCLRNTAELSPKYPYIPVEHTVPDKAFPTSYKKPASLEGRQYKELRVPQPAPSSPDSSSFLPARTPLDSALSRPPISSAQSEQKRKRDPSEKEVINRQESLESSEEEIRTGVIAIVVSTTKRLADV